MNHLRHPLSDLARTNALTTTSANLCFLVIASNMTRAAQVLTDRELQSAVAAQRPRVGSNGGGSSDSDPTGNAALAGAAVELRARDIVAGWNTDVRETSVMLRWVRNQACELTGEAAPPHGQPGIARSLRDLRALTTIPRSLARAAAQTLDGDDALEFDCAIISAHDHAARVRFGVAPVPGVVTVLEQARHALAATPPKPKQKKLQTCGNCAVHGFDVATVGGKTRCDRCIEFRKTHGFAPDEKICRLWFFHPKRQPSFGMIEEARAASRPSRKRSA